MRKTYLATTSYEEEGVQEAGRNKELGSSLKPPERNAALQHLDFSSLSHFEFLTSRNIR